jgi:hypothetical protein
MGGYSSSLNACTVHALRSSMNLTVNVQHPLNQLMALIRRRDSD